MNVVTNSFDAGANAVAENPENGARYETVTTQTGNYTLVQVPVGSYHLTIELPGFGRFRQDGIRIFVGQTARIDATLKVGNLAEEVTVVADASLVDTQSAEIRQGRRRHRVAGVGLPDVALSRSLPQSKSSRQGRRRHRSRGRGLVSMSH